MASLRLDRKARRNYSKQAKRKEDIKRLTATPVIKKVDIEELKKSFAK